MCVCVHVCVYMCVGVCVYTITKRNNVSINLKL